MIIDPKLFRPMLAAKTEDYDWDKLTYPILASPKLDGIRCIIHPQLGAVTRSLKPIPNKYIREYLSQPQFKWLDGEIVIGDIAAPDVFNKTQSAVMSHGGEPDFTYRVFDNFSAGNVCGFGIRLEDARNVVAAANDTKVFLLEHRRLEHWGELTVFEEACVQHGFEGAMVRSLQGKYKFGRSTLREQGLLKMKRFEDDEAIIVGYEPLMRNLNDPIVDALGLQKRGYSKDGKVADDTRIGVFNVIGVIGSRWDGVAFSVGSGLSSIDRIDARNNIEKLIQRQQKLSFKYQPHGSLDAPRMPIFKGYRYD